MRGSQHVLVIGGTRFMGYLLVWRLLTAGHRVTLLNRGTQPDPFGDRVERLRADRTTPDFAATLDGRRFDAVVDFAAFTGADAEGVVKVLGDGRAGHYILISTGSVYTVLEDAPWPSRESDYDGPLLPRPSDPADENAWLYGVGKREAEDVLAEAWEDDGFPATRLRLPIVNGERDQSRRLESYMWRLLDGGPLLLPDGGAHHVRHVYSGAVVRTIVDLLGQEKSFGRAYNLCQDEIPSLAEVAGILAEALGADLRIVPVSAEELGEVGLELSALSPFTSRWNSCLDPCRAKLDLGFWHEPLRVYLDRIAAAFLGHLPDEPPPGYAQRPAELELAERLTA